MGPACCSPAAHPTAPLQPKRGTSRFRLGLMLLILLGDAPLPAEELLRLDLPRQPLAAALNQFARVAGIQLICDGTLLQGKSAPAVRGRFSTDLALARLLENSGLDFLRTGPAAVTVRRLRAPAPTPPARLPEVLVTAPAPLSGNAQSYNPRWAVTATRTETPVMETPMAIRSLPPRLLQDLQAVRVDEAVQWVSGVNVSTLSSDHFIRTGGTQTARFLKLRGFPAQEFYRDGMRVPEAVGGIPELAGLERIEVLKGPASTLYGRQEPGGIVNLITKQPRPTEGYNLQQQFGSFDYFRTLVDAGGPAGTHLDYRLNLAYESTRSFRDLLGGDHIFVNPVLRWNLSERSQATLEVEHLGTHDRLRDNGFPMVQGRPAPIPIRRTFDTPGRGDDEERDRLSLHGNHEFSDRWRLTHRFDAIWNRMVRRPYRAAGIDEARLCGATCRIGTFDTPRVYTDTTTYFTGLNLNGEFDTGAFTHNLLVGADFQQTEVWRASALYWAYYERQPDRRLLDIFRPPVRAPITAPAYAPVDTYGDDTQDRYGIYLQDQLRLPWNISLLAGMRYDLIDQGVSHYFSPQGPIDRQQLRKLEDAVTPRFGLVWRPLPELSLYGNYLKNFGAGQVQPGPSGRLLPSETALQWEAGIKTEWLDGALSASLAWFDLTKSNMAVADPKHLNVFLPIGAANSRGLELELAGAPLPGWNISLAYTYDDARITGSSGAAAASPIGRLSVGNRLSGVPRHAFNFWNTFSPRQGMLQGWSFGAGVAAKSPQANDYSGIERIPGYALLNLMAAYERSLGNAKLRLQLNVDNLADKTYFIASDWSGYAYPGSPRLLRGSIGLEW